MEMRTEMSISILLSSINTLVELIGIYVETDFNST